jgi:hypothetical protein
MKVLPVPEIGVTSEFPDYCFVFRKHSISILTCKKAKELKLIRHQALHSHDSLSDAFVTGQVPSCVLHYFEQAHTHKGKLKYRTYNIF